MLTGKQLIDDINTCDVKRGHCAYWWLGQHSFIVKLGRTVLYLDVFLSPFKSRTVPPLLKPEECTNADAFLGTHDHADHIDRACWPGMAAASSRARMVVPKLLRERIVKDLSLDGARVLGLDEGITQKVDDVTISAVPAAHELLDTDPATGLHPYLGYIISGNDFTIYHAGDTCIYEGMQGKLRQWKLDLAFLPINGRDAKRLKSNCIGNMTYQEAVDLAGSVRPRVTVPTHFEMFTGNSENPQLFMDYMAAKYPDLRGQIPVHGQRTLV